MKYDMPLAAESQVTVTELLVGVATMLAGGTQIPKAGADAVVNSATEENNPVGVVVTTGTPLQNARTRYSYIDEEDKLLNVKLVDVVVVPPHDAVFFKRIST
jgi:hypothetical protein